MPRSAADPLGRRRSDGSWLRDLAGAVVPLALRDLADELDARLASLPNRWNSFGFDPFGFSPARARQLALISAALYRYYFRTETHGIGSVPAGRVLIIANHAGQLPADAMVLGSALLLEAQPPRLARGMAEYWVSHLPWVSVWAARSGAMVGTRANCIQMLENGECVMAFPEGVRGLNKLYRERYRLQRFGLGFMRLALETQTPIVPVGIVGSEEQQPSFANLEGLARRLRMPALPITLGFPWLGPLGLLPLPVKYHLHFGEPMRLSGDPQGEDRELEGLVESVRREIEKLIRRGLDERRGIFT